jgi:hypothetical protein
MHWRRERPGRGNVHHVRSFPIFIDFCLRLRSVCSFSRPHSTQLYPECSRVKRVCFFYSPGGSARPGGQGVCGRRRAKRWGVLLPDPPATGVPGCGVMRRVYVVQFHSRLKQDGDTTSEGRPFVSIPTFRAVLHLGTAHQPARHAIRIRIRIRIRRGRLGPSR